MSNTDHQNSTQTPKATTAETNLSSVVEREESPDNAPPRSLNAIMSAPMPPPHTPGASSPIKPPMSEMHPSKVHPTMAAPSSSLRLGFTDIKQAGGNRNQAADTTPSKTVPASDFTFRFVRPNVTNTGLSEKAQRMMDELREEAMRIKAELAAKREQELLEDEDMYGRKIAQPKGKASRYSAAHMAEFKKMDSIENHPSAFRAQPGRFTPVAKSLKRTQSKANLDDSESLRSKAGTPVASLSKTKKNIATPSRDGSASPSKRIRQQLEDDVSTRRPVSRDPSSIPRPTTAGKVSTGLPRSQTTASFMTPTRTPMSTTSRSTGIAKTPVHRLFAKLPTKPISTGMKKSATTDDLAATPSIANETKSGHSASIRGPGRLDRVKSILRGNKPSTTLKEKSASRLPMAPVSKTPAPERTLKELPPLPLSTPGRKIAKRVEFTPDTKRAAMTQNSPSPFKPAIPRSKSRNDNSEAVQYPKFDSVMTQAGSSTGAVFYPDLSSHRPLPALPTKGSETKKLPQEASGSFTFRSDHTISFGSTSSSGFGVSAGQTSLRRVRPSFMPTAEMPGSFPCSRAGTVESDKENSAPPVNLLPRAAPAGPNVNKALSHGLSSKKRHRASTDDEDETEHEAAKRAAKKRQNVPVPEGDALLAPRLTARARTPGSVKHKPPMGFGGAQTPGLRTPSPIKKKPVLSMSRLNMLARPKRTK